MANEVATEVKEDLKEAAETRLDRLLAQGAAAVVDLSKPVRGMDHIPLRHPSASDLRGIKLLDLINMDTVSLELVVPRIAMNGFTKHDFLNLEPKDMFSIGLQVSGFFAL